MTTITTELVDITRNIKWAFMSDNDSFIDFALYKRKIVPMKVQ